MKEGNGFTEEEEEEEHESKEAQRERENKKRTRRARRRLALLVVCKATTCEVEFGQPLSSGSSSLLWSRPALLPVALLLRKSLRLG